MAESARYRQNSRQISLTETLSTIDGSVEPVAPRAVELINAAGLTLANDAVMADTKIRLAGARLRRIDLSLLAGAGVETVDVRVPNFMTVLDNDDDLYTNCAMIKGAIESEGGAATIVTAPLEVAFEKPGFDAAIVFREQISGALGETAQIAFDGVALAPGGGIAFGNVNGRPILLLPERFDGALAGWLAIGRRLLARLAFRLIEEQPFLLELARPIASARGMAEIVPVRRRAAQVEPLPHDSWSPQTIARADGWILVPAESDGLPAGAKVQMRAWP